MITDLQRDALTEIINIGFSRAAASLSELTGHRVQLDVPEVALYPINELSGVLHSFLEHDIATVHQIFTGPIAGDALLVLSTEHAALLSRLLTREQSRSPVLNTSDQEVLTEIGNIVLNACLGTFGNLLQVRVSFAVPRLTLDSLDGLLNSLIISSEELRYGLVIFTNFRLRDSSISGYLVIVLGIASLDWVITEAEKLG